MMLIIVGLIVITSFMFQSNLLAEMSWMTLIVLVTLVITTLAWKPKKQPTPSPVEILFYEDYFIVYKGKRYYSSKVSHREYFKFYYAEVSEMNYDLRTYRFNIYGNVEATFYKYLKDGTLPQYPYHHKKVNDGICYFYLIDNDKETIVNTMEYYVHKKVIYRNKLEE